MAIKDYGKLILFLETTKFNCGYELVILFAAIKLKNERGGFQRERLVDFFIDFYKIRKEKKLALKKYCNPLEKEDRNKIKRLINRNPIGFLLKVGILKTFERFNANIFNIILNNEEEILLTIKERIINHYMEMFGDSKENIEEVLSEWEVRINENIKLDASKKFAEYIEKIDVEILLKYLYQSYNIRNFNDLLKYFHITQREFDDYFNSKIKFNSKFSRSEENRSQIPKAEKDQGLKKFSNVHMRDLTLFFQKMKEESGEEEEETN
ncbi:MAG: hypothetical protein ACFFD2_09765 [Promethearchaeota archaeon]